MAELGTATKDIGFGEQMWVPLRKETLDGQFFQLP
jgi:hypothetical protein